MNFKGTTEKEIIINIKNCCIKNDNKFRIVSLIQDLAEARQETEKQREIMNIISRMINDSKQKELRK